MTDLIVFALWCVGIAGVFLCACGVEALIVWGRDRWRWFRWFNWQ